MKEILIILSAIIAFIYIMHLIINMQAVILIALSAGLLSLIVMTVRGMVIDYFKKDDENNY